MTAGYGKGKTTGGIEVEGCEVILMLSEVEQEGGVG